MCMLFLHNFPAEAFPFFLQEMPRLTGYTTDNLHQRSQIFHISIYYRLFLPPAGKRDCSFTFIRLFFHCFQLTKLSNIARSSAPSSSPPISSLELDNTWSIPTPYQLRSEVPLYDNSTEQTGVWSLFGTSLTRY